ncbi:hypothetical protein, partial [Raoultella terrigena]|uniref:hypothetical protein n=1 Tax=Raoultella terrigena TaxID=577 RepID=UPI00132F6464
VIGGIAGYGTAGAAVLYAGYQIYEVRGILQDVELAYTVVTSLADAHVSLADFTSSVPVPQMVEAP